MKLIAETAWHHEGDFSFMTNLVNELINKSKADYLKFHITLDLDEYMDKNYSIYKTLSEWMFNKEYWTKLIDRTIEGNKDIMLLFNDKKSIEFGMKFNPKLVEIHSVCINDNYLLNALKSTINKETKIVLGVGGTNIYEIESALNVLQHQNIVLMFGFQNYPTNYEDINFNKIRRTMSLFPNYEFGYADHTGWDESNNILITLMGAALGMDYIEKHVTNHYGIQRCDWNAAINIDMLNEIADKIQILNKCNGNGLLQMSQGEKKYSIFGPMKKAALLLQDVNKGDKLTSNKFSFKRAEQTSDLSQMDAQEKIGETFNQNLPAGTIIMKKHFEI